MAQKKKPFRMAPLLRVKVIEITDPAEQAALDEKIKRSRVYVMDLVPESEGEARGHAGKGGQRQGGKAV